MGLLKGREFEGGYQPSLLHRLLKPKISGNTINGLGETEPRLPTPVYHRRYHWHPWFLVQESFYAREYWDPVQAKIMFKSMRMDHQGFRPIAGDKESDSPGNWAQRVKKKALEHPDAHIAGIAAVTPELLFDREHQLNEITEPWIIVIGRAMDYEQLSRNLDKPNRRWTPFWRNHFLPAAHEVLRTYVASQTAAWELANWIRSKGHDARAQGGPKGGPINTLAAAMAAGLGELGKHGSLMSAELGSCMRFAYVLTDMPLAPDSQKEVGVDEFCASCRLCTEACPPRAISDSKQMVRGVVKWYVDFDKCVPYFNESNGCALCLSVCPWSLPGVAPNLSRKMLRKRTGANSR